MNVAMICTRFFINHFGKSFAIWHGFCHKFNKQTFINMDYKYKLKKVGKYICPQCGQKRFVPYVYNDGSEQIVDVNRFGRCDREQSCGFHEYPHDVANEKIFIPKHAEPVREPDYIPKAFFEPTIDDRFYLRNVLFNGLLRKGFKAEQLIAAFKKYSVGTTRDGSTIWWQIDTLGNIRTGKIMRYLPNTHRDKDAGDKVNWVHTKIKSILGRETFDLRQCFFGLNQIHKGDSVCVVESEKTAVCMSILMPTHTWIATGGLGMISFEKIAALEVLEPSEIILCPDKGCYFKWKEKTNNAYQVDTTLEMIDELPDGADYLDTYIK